MEQIKSIRKSISSSFHNKPSMTRYSTSKILLGFATFLAVAAVLWWIYTWWLAGGSNLKDVPNMKRPFLNMWGVRKDGTEFLVNIVFITHPFTRDECIVQYNDAKDKGCHFLGLSSYSEFPGLVSNPHDVLHDPKNKAWTDYDYFKLSRGWLSCFREENNTKWIKSGFPQVNIAESDFANYEVHKPDPSVKKEYDFIELELNEKALWFAEEWGIRNLIRNESDEGFIGTVKLHNHDWAIRAVLALSGEMKIPSHKVLRQEVADRAAASLANYST